MSENENSPEMDLAFDRFLCEDFSTIDSLNNDVVYGYLEMLLHDFSTGPIAKIVIGTREGIPYAMSVVKPEDVNELMTVMQVSAAGHRYEGIMTFADTYYSKQANNPVTSRPWGRGEMETIYQEYPEHRGKAVSESICGFYTTDDGTRMWNLSYHHHGDEVIIGDRWTCGDGDSETQSQGLLVEHAKKCLDWENPENPAAQRFEFARAQLKKAFSHLGEERMEEMMSTACMMALKNQSAVLEHGILDPETFGSKLAQAQ